MIAKRKKIKHTAEMKNAEHSLLLFGFLLLLPFIQDFYICKLGIVFCLYFLIEKKHAGHTINCLKGNSSVVFSISMFYDLSVLSNCFPALQKKPHIHSTAISHPLLA